MFFVSSWAWDKEKNSESRWGIEPQTFDSALRFSTTEPQRLHGERGLLWSSYDTHPAYCQDQQCRQRHILNPRINKYFASHAVDVSFVRYELSKQKLPKATGLDKIPTKLFKDAASVIVKPVTYFINLAISTGDVPSQRKEAKVTPIYKTERKDDENNYRPISVLPLISKVMERAVQVQLLAFLDENKILSVFQSGFRKKYSTETAVVYLVDLIFEHMDWQQLTGAALIDLKRPLILLITTASLTSKSTMELEDVV